MIQPEELKTTEPLTWSVGTGVEVWQLFCACCAGDLGETHWLLDNNPALANCQYAYRTPLYFAVRENRLEIARYLLGKMSDALSLAINDSLLQIARDRGYLEMQELLETFLADVYGAAAKGESVAAAIRAHDVERVRQLLDASPELLHTGDMRSNQPIHWASMTRQLDMIDELLARGADVDARRYDGARPIQLANGDYHFRGWRDVPADWPVNPLQVIQHLLARGAEYDINTACRLGDVKRVQELLSQDAGLANYLPQYITYYLGSGTPLRNAAAVGDIEIVKLLLDYGADPNLPEEGIAPQGHALYAAVVNRHYDVVKLLLDHGAHPNPEVESSADALTRAKSNNDVAMVELLCSYGAARQLHLLAHDGDIVTAAAMLHANPQLARDPGALAGAASGGFESFVRLLLHYVPDLPRRIEFPSWSVGAKTRELNELLFAHGMDPNQRDWLHVTPLHHFARTNDVERAELFVAHGADLHARDEDICSTPLGWAAKYNSRDMAEFLLKSGAQVQLPDDPPWATPLAWATRRGHHEMVELLKQYESAEHPM